MDTFLSTFRNNELFYITKLYAAAGVAVDPEILHHEVTKLHDSLIRDINANREFFTELLNIIQNIPCCPSSGRSQWVHKVSVSAVYAILENSNNLFTEQSISTRYDVLNTFRGLMQLYELGSQSTAERALYSILNSVLAAGAIRGIIPTKTIQATGVHKVVLLEFKNLNTDFYVNVDYTTRGVTVFKVDDV